jgi:hypothetical protein
MKENEFNDPMYYLHTILEKYGEVEITLGQPINYTEKVFCVSITRNGVRRSCTTSDLHRALKGIVTFD